MAETKHTPWTIAPNMLNPRQWAIFDANGDVVLAEAGEDEDLARLIAAAPKLLHALREVDDLLSDFPDDDGALDIVREVINEAIAKATADG